MNIDLPEYRSVAQLVESRSPKPVVAGSSPAWPVINMYYPMKFSSETCFRFLDVLVHFVTRMFGA